ncbi:MAG: dihydrolipoyl dehydrogenase, partial [Pseudomonadota bacterium]
TKALLRTAEMYTAMQHAGAYGLRAENVGFDLDAVVKRSRDIAGKLSGGVSYLMKKNKIDILRGVARLKKSGSGGSSPDIHVAQADGGEVLVTAKHVILATGARARTLPKIGLTIDNPAVWTAREAMTPDIMPTSIAVVGSGAIGIEFASFFNAMGAEVTVLETVDRILPSEDEEISAFAQKQLAKLGVKFELGATVEKVAAADDGARVSYINANGEDIALDVDRVIAAIGIIGNTEDLGLEDVGVETDRGHVVVNEWLETSAHGVYAIGDLVGPPWLAHKASHEGVICVERIAGLNEVHPLEINNIPGCTYCNPQVASVGMTERGAIDAGYAVKVGRFPFNGNGKAIALGEPEGMVKTVFDEKTGELLGAHMVGAEVTELIQGFGIAKTLEATEQDLFHTVFPHPTLSEMMHEASLDAFGRVVHI